MVPPPAAVKPVGPVGPAVPMTGAVNAIGVTPRMVEDTPAAPQ